MFYRGDVVERMVRLLEAIAVTGSAEEMVFPSGYPSAVWLLVAGEYRSS